MENQIKEIINVLLSDYTIDKMIDAFYSNQKIISHENTLFDSRLFMPKKNIVNFEYLASCPFGHAFEVVAQYDQYNQTLCLTERFYDYFIQNKNSFRVKEGIEIKNFGYIESNMISAWSIESLLIIQQSRDAKGDVFGNNLEYYLVEDGELNIFIKNKYNISTSLHSIFAKYSQNPIAVGTYKNGRLGVCPTINYKDIFEELSSLGLLSMDKFI